MMEFVEPCVFIVTVDECRLSSGSQAHVKIPSTALSDLTHPIRNKIIPHWYDTSRSMVTVAAHLKNVPLTQQQS